ncbi:transposase (fragment) [uncultured Alphaproteobacteria bacterium]|uniref:Transposase n=1 Tax=uncultured Alphaproteobacteria bacterium TaxID=91750 RepID=A0A212KDC3_9PROT
MLEPTAHTPDDPETLHRIIADLSGRLAVAEAGLVAKALEIETMKVQLARLRHQQFGRSSEKLTRQIEQLELGREDLEAD